MFCQEEFKSIVMKSIRPAFALKSGWPFFTVQKYPILG